MLVRDTFDRANSALSLGTADVGGAWVQAAVGGGASNFGIQANRAYVAAGVAATDVLAATLNQGTNAHYVEATAYVAGGADGHYLAGLVGNYEDASNFSVFFVFHLEGITDPITCTEYEGAGVLQVVGGVLELRQLNLFTLPSTTLPLRAEFSEGRVTGYVEGGLVTSGPVTKALSPLAGTRVGIAVLGAQSSNAVTFDDFLSDALPEVLVAGCGTWTTASDAAECCSSAVSLSVLDETVRVASELLYVLSKRQFTGLCSDVVRPCRRDLRWDGPLNHFQVVPRNSLGQCLERWDESWGSCSCGSVPCGCGDGDVISLGAWPVVSVEQVLIDGVAVDPATYRVDDLRWLRRLDGQSWPCCQDIDLAPTEVGTFQVSFTHGVAPPRAGVLAAKRLACELALSCAGSQECKLPKRIQQVTRQGLTMLLLDPFDFIREGRTGLYEVDLFLGAFTDEDDAAVVVTPDVNPSVLRTTWGG